MPCEPETIERDGNPIAQAGTQSDRHSESCRMTALREVERMPKPTKFTILAQQTISGRTAVLERYHTPKGFRYRVTAAERFDKPGDAKAAFMSVFPEDKRDKITDISF